jgi:DNA segregation ATPase FtsK/SpoIIIE, S-DNA-T family
MGLFALTMLLTVSVVTRHPADPIQTSWPLSSFYQPDELVFPPAERIQNACGRLGALLSGLLVDNLGIASALVIAAMGGATAALMLRGSMNAPVLRSFGGTITVPAAATIAALTPISLQGMPVIGNGGTLGAMSSTWLLDHFAPAGAWILSMTTLGVGLLLVTDYALLYAGKRIVEGGRMVSAASVRRAAAVIPIQRRVRQPFTDLQSPILIEGDEPTSEALPVSKLRAIELPISSQTLSSDLSLIDGDGPRIKAPSKPALKSGVGEAIAGAAAGLAAAAGLSAAADALRGKKHDEVVDDEYEYEEDYDGDGDWEDEEDPTAETKEIELEGETVQLREDDPHESVSEPLIKPPTKKNASKPKDERQHLMDTLVDRPPEGSDDYRLPSIELLIPGDDVSYDEQFEEVKRTAKVLEETFKNFGFNIKVVEIETGPVIAQYEIELEAGLRLSKITGLADDIAIALRVPSVRIVAPIPGKNTVGIEVPNEIRQIVRIRDVIEQAEGKTKKLNIPIFLGQDVAGNPLVVDLAKMPHLLIAGRTGTGKSVCLNAIVCSILMQCRPDEVRMLMIDPKMVEMSGYGKLPHLMHPVITDMRKAEAILAWAVEKMEERYSLLAKVGVRHINSFNELGREEVLRRLEVDEEDGPADIPDKLPFIVIIADEMADLIMTAGKDVEQHIIRLAQKSRAVGIHLILATQKPTVDVITGLIKSNLPARLSFQVASKTDSRVVLDENGADKLLGNGDMLFLWPGTSTLIRGQCTYLTDGEIDAICAHCSQTEQSFASELMNLKVAEEGEGGGTTIEKIKQRDDLYDSAIEIVIREGRGSCSLLQRCLGIGYGRAAKLIDFMAEDGIVGEYNGAKAREVVMTMPQWQALQGLDSSDTDGHTSEPAPVAKKSPEPKSVTHKPTLANIPASIIKATPAKPSTTKSPIPKPHLAIPLAPLREVEIADDGFDDDGAYPEDIDDESDQEVLLDDENEYEEVYEDEEEHESKEEHEEEDVENEHRLNESEDETDEEYDYAEEDVEDALDYEDLEEAIEEKLNEAVEEEEVLKKPAAKKKRVSAQVRDEDEYEDYEE